MQQQYGGGEPNQQRGMVCEGCGQEIPIGDFHMHEGMRFPQLQQAGPPTMPMQQQQPMNQQQVQPQGDYAPPREGLVGKIITGASRGIMSFIGFIFLLNSVLRVIYGTSESITKVNEATSGFLPDIENIESFFEPFGSVVTLIGFVLLFSSTIWLAFRLKVVSVIASIVGIVIAASAYQWVTTTDFGEFVAPLINLNPFDLFGYANLKG